MPLVAVNNTFGAAAFWQAVAAPAMVMVAVGNELTIIVPVVLVCTHVPVVIIVSPYVPVLVGVPLIVTLPEA